MNIPVSVIIVTRNEAVRLRRCLEALHDFDEVIVVDSKSTDGTQDIAQQCGAQVINFEWNGAYPKKRQWCLDHLELQHDWVFFVDADEVVTPALIEEIGGLDFAATGYFAGYFIRGRYVWDGHILQHGLHNNKLALIDRRKIEFPVVDDLGIGGMGEIEGHYQPVLKAEYTGESIGQLKAFLLHYAYEDMAGWEARHQRYAQWERGMDAQQIWPGEVKMLRRIAKRVFKRLPFRGLAAFIHSYILKRGFLDGAPGLKFAQSRYRYYQMI